MPDSVRSFLSAAVHAGVGILVTWLVAHGIDLSADWSTLAQTAILAAVVAGYTALTSWLSTRTGISTFAVAARFIAKVLTLGTGALITATPRAAAK